MVDELPRGTCFRFLCFDREVFIVFHVGILKVLCFRWFVRAKRGKWELELTLYRWCCRSKGNDTLMEDLDALKWDMQKQLLLL